MSGNTPPKTIHFLGSAKKDIRAFPAAVRIDVGFALFQVQHGSKPYSAKPLKGFGGAGVLEIVENFDGNTYRAVYTVKFVQCIYVLHCFQKKSKHGIATPIKEIELIQNRLKTAMEHYDNHYK